MKLLAKKIVPPFFYELVRQIINKPKDFHPVWNTLNYEPLKGVEMFFDPNGHWQRKMVDGTYDGFLFQNLKNMDIKGKIIFDVGSHIGYHSLYFGRLVGNNGKVYSFEPYQKNFDRFNLILEKNKNLLGNISTYEIAVSDKIGTEEFNLNEDIESGRSSGNFIGRADTFWNKEIYARKGFRKTSVKTLPIDLFKDKLKINDLPDIIKIDVEGAEYLVLLGVKNITREKPILFIEIHSMLNMYNVLTFLYSLSYKVEMLNTDPNGVCFIKAEYKK